MKIHIFYLAFGLALIQFSNTSKADPFCPLQSIDSFEDIKNVIHNANIQSVGDFVSCLPEEYRKNYTALYESRSPEKDDVDYMHPRIISFGDIAKFVIAFTGKPGGNQKVQILDYSQTKTQHYELDFSTSETLSHSLNIKNPPHCIQCHRGYQGSFKPIWRGYPLWKGAYGSADDFFLPILSDYSTPILFNYDRFKAELKENSSDEHSFSQIVLKRDDNRSNTSFGSKKSLEEIENINRAIRRETEHYRDFKKSKDSSSIYKNLSSLPSWRHYVSTPRNKLKREPDVSVRPNLLLTDLLFSRNAENIIARFRESPEELELLKKLEPFCHLTVHTPELEKIKQILIFPDLTSIQLSLHEPNYVDEMPFWLFCDNGNFADCRGKNMSNYFVAQYYSDLVKRFVPVDKRKYEPATGAIVDHAPLFLDYINEIRSTFATRDGFCEALLKLDLGSAHTIPRAAIPTHSSTRTNSR